VQSAAVLVLRRKANLSSSFGHTTQLVVGLVVAAVVAGDGSDMGDWWVGAGSGDGPLAPLYRAVVVL
jgi:hypothetical protein